MQHEVDGWLQVVNMHGEVGLVPSSFVHVLQPGEVNPAAVGAAGAALSSAVSTGFEGIPGQHDSLDMPTEAHLHNCSAAAGCCA